MKKRILTILFLCVGLLSATEYDLDNILKKIDDLYKSESSFAKIEMNIETPHWQRTLTLKSWSKGTEKTFIRIISPKKEKGMATLKLEKEMWNYLPKVNKVMKIPPSMMMSSWMGSDFTNDDLVKEYRFVEDYNFSIIKDEKEFLKIKCIPKEGRPIIWGHIILKLRKSDYIPLIEEYYDENGKLVRIMNFKEIKEFDGKKIPSILELIPVTKEGNKTTVKYLELDLNIEVKDNVFSLRNLRKRN